MQGWTPDMMRALVRDLDRVHYMMPPWSGTAEEADLVAAYLKSIAKPRPVGMLPPSGPLSRLSPRQAGRGLG